MEASERVPVPGSERQIEPGHRRIGDIDPQSDVELTVYVRPQAPADWVDEEAARPPSERRRLTREQWASAHGASAEDLAAVRSFAERAGLTVTGVDPAQRAIHLRGPLQAAAAAFGAQMEGQYAPAQGAPGYRARRGPLTVPAHLKEVVTGVFGLDDRPQARTQVHRAAAAASSFTPVQIADAYGFPSPATGRGETVGILELGGGFNTSDLQAYFTGLGLSAPVVTAVSVDGGKNAPGVDQNADGEVIDGPARAAGD